MGGEQQKRKRNPERGRTEWDKKPIRRDGEQKFQECRETEGVRIHRDGEVRIHRDGEQMF